MKLKFFTLILFTVFLYGCDNYDLVKEMDASYIEAHKVLLTMKDGSKTSGYVFWGEWYKGNYPYEPKKFLNYFLHPPAGGGPMEFELYKTLSRINDGGAFGGYAESEEDKLDVPPNSVASIEDMPDKLNGTRLGAYCFLHKKQIKVMQKPFLFEEDATKGERTYHALNYDPHVSKKKLHQLLQDFCRNIDKDKTIWEYDITAKSAKVVFVFIDMTDD